MNSSQVKIAIVGGSGLAELDGMEIIRIIPPYDLESEFGMPAGPVTIGTIAGKTVAFMCRHGVGHAFNPTTVPYRANAMALAMLGIEKAFAFSACGSLIEEIQPGILTVPDQLIDKTTKRAKTFFDQEGLTVHVGMAKPFCENVRQEMLTALRETGIDYFEDKNKIPKMVYVTMEGPQFSTDAEHDYYIKTGSHLIGMTTSPEAHLMREAGICYGVVALPTDVYTIAGEHKAVNVELVMKTFGENIEKVKRLIPVLIQNTTVSDCTCHHSLDGAVQSDPRKMSIAQTGLLRKLQRQ